MPEAFQITEAEFQAVKDDVRDLKSAYPEIIQQQQESYKAQNQAFCSALQVQSNAFSKALDQSANSLSIPLLRDVLVPLIMKLFLFFAALTMGILGTVIGIKWLAGDLLKSLP